MSRPRRNPIFLVDLMADAQGIHYSTPLQNYETVLISLFDKGIQACQSVPQLEKVGILPLLFFVLCSRVSVVCAMEMTMTTSINGHFLGKPVPECLHSEFSLI